ncbi:MAG: SRPBCC family protein [Dehalococcoidia bacterium]
MPGTMTLTTPGDREVEVRRSFAAPRTLVFDAYTVPELVKRWFGGPEGWSLAVCEIDLRVGGKWRYVIRHTDGMEMGFGGEYLEIVRPERLVSTERFDEPWYPGEGLNTLALSEANGVTTLTMTIRYESKEARDIALATPMESGLAAGFDSLEAFMATEVANRA